MFPKTCLEKTCLRCLGSNRNNSESFSKNNVFLVSTYLFLPLANTTIFDPFSQICPKRSAGFITIVYTKPLKLL